MLLRSIAVLVAANVLNNKVAPRLGPLTSAAATAALVAMARRSGLSWKELGFEHGRKGAVTGGVLAAGVAAVYTVGINVPRGRSGRTDIIRVEGMELRKRETDRLALLGTHVTVSIVKGGRVSRKQRLEVPERLVGVIRCANPTCITNHERIAPVFDRTSVDPLQLRCAYCERANVEPSVWCQTPS